MSDITTEQFMTLFEQSRPCFRVYGKQQSITDTLLALLCDITISAAPKKKGAKNPPSVLKQIVGSEKKEPAHQTLTLKELQSI